MLHCSPFLPTLTLHVTLQSPLSHTDTSSYTTAPLSHTYTSCYTTYLFLELKTFISQIYPSFCTTCHSLYSLRCSHLFFILTLYITLQVFFSLPYTAATYLSYLHFLSLSLSAAICVSHLDFMLHYRSLPLFITLPPFNSNICKSCYTTGPRSKFWTNKRKTEKK